MEVNNIPKHWKAVKVSEIGVLIRGVNYKKEESTNAPADNYLPILRGNNINGELNYDDLVYVKKKNISDTQLVKKGDIVFAMSSGSKHLVGKSAKARSDFYGGFGAFCGVFRANVNVNKDFVAYFFQSPYYKKIISEISKGTNINNLKREHILDLDFPSPPLTEQLSIVSKIEELLSDLENGKQQLQLAQQQLKVYRQSLLKWAFEGKLTKENVEVGELPKGWKIVELKDVANKITDGEHFRPKVQDNGIPFLSAKDVRDWGVSFNEPLYISEDTAKKALGRCNPQRGDILIVSRGATVGRMCIVNTDRQFCLLGSVILIKVKDTINSKLINFILKSPIANQKMITISGATAQQAIYLRDIKYISIPLPPFEERCEIFFMF